MALTHGALSEEEEVLMEKPSAPKGRWYLAGAAVAILVLVGVVAKAPFWMMSGLVAVGALGTRVKVLWACGFARDLASWISGTCPLGPQVAEMIDNRLQQSEVLIKESRAKPCILNPSCKGTRR
ncbi:unnamed protein product [Symbiodinium necroappetens]|uniref:Uncharacterized protein n=1 Tax=Symbiodinium necroappetens TaxID=1628268 RepID=A0A813ARM2_9DINO|nr:unnamed protein product [Symbiodinium necroappetens]